MWARLYRRPPIPDSLVREGIDTTLINESSGAVLIIAVSGEYVFVVTSDGRLGWLYNDVNSFVDLAT